MTRIITVTSGKGGVGKTSISVNLALALAAAGYRTCLFDADFGLANVDILLNLHPQHTLADVIEGRCALREIVVTTEYGFDIIPGSSGLEMMANLDAGGMASLTGALAELDSYDFVLFDTASGVSEQVISFCLAAPEVLLVITSEPTSLTDAYSLLKILSLNHFDGRVRMVVNNCRTQGIAAQTYAKFNEVVQLYLSLEIPLLGSVGQDAKVPEAIKCRQPLLALHPETAAAKGIKALADQLAGIALRPPANAGMAAFWMRYLKCVKGSLTLIRTRKTAAATATPAVAPEADVANISEISGQPGGATGEASASQVAEPAHDQMMAMLAALSEEVRALRAAVDRLEGRPPVAALPERMPPPVAREEARGAGNAMDAVPTPAADVPSLLREYPCQVTRSLYGEETIDLYQIVRKSGAPLMCCFHRAPPTAGDGLPEPGSLQSEVH